MRRFSGSGTKRPVPSSALAEELRHVALGGGPQSRPVLPGQQGQALPFVQPAVGHSGKRRAVLTPPPAQGGRAEVIDLTLLDSDDEGEQCRPRAHEQEDEIEEEAEEAEDEEEVEDSYVYHYDSDASDGEAAGGSFTHRMPPAPHRTNSLGMRIAESFAGAASDLPDLHPLELHYSPTHSPHFTITLHLDGVPYSIKCIPSLSETSRLDRAIVGTSDPAAPFPGFMTRLLGAFLPHVMEATDEGALRNRISECMNALYVESVRMLKTEKASTASSEQQAVDCERIVSLLGPLVRYQSPALRLLHASTFLMRHYERFCYVCGRVHDLPAEVETQEALLCERARESDVRVTSVVRVHVCGAELCAHTATEAFGLMAPAMETRINGGTVTEFLLDAVSNAGRSGKMDLFSYVPPDYVKPGHDNNGAGRGDIDGGKLLAGVCDLRRLTYAKMKECIDAPPNDDEDPGPEGLERRFRGLFDTLFTDSRDPTKPERIYKLYWWLCVCYKSHLREVPLSYVTDYFTKIRPLSAAHQPQLAVMVQQVQESCASRSMVVLEMINDRRPKRRTFEAKRQSILSSSKGTNWIAFHGSRSENWHSLLQTGVQVLSNTPHMLNGAAYGKGVYTSNTFNTSLGYSLGVGLGFSSSSTNVDAPPVGIVEVACDAHLKPANITAIPDGDGVCLKFIVVKRHQPAQGGEK